MLQLYELRMGMRVVLDESQVYAEGHMHFGKSKCMRQTASYESSNDDWR